MVIQNSSKGRREDISYNAASFEPVPLMTAGSTFSAQHSDAELGFFCWLPKSGCCPLSQYLFVGLEVSSMQR